MILTFFKIIPLENEIEELTLDEINEMLDDTSVENQQPTPEGESDLIYDILKEIEMGKK